MKQYIEEAITTLSAAGSRVHRAIAEADRLEYPANTSLKLGSALLSIDGAVQTLKAARAAAVTFERERYEATHAQSGPDGEKTNAG